MSFLRHRIQSWITCYFWLSRLLSVPQSRASPQYFFVFFHLWLWRIQVSCSVTCPSSAVPSYLKFRWCIFVKTIIEVMLCPFHCIILGSKWCLHISLLAIWIWLLVRHFCWFTNVKLVFSPMYLLSILWEDTLRLYKHPGSHHTFSQRF